MVDQIFEDRENLLDLTAKIVFKGKNTLKPDFHEISRMKKT